MPRYLRWLVAISSGIMATFTFTVLIAGIAKATHRSATHFSLTFSSLVTIGAFVVPAIVMLAVNDWLLGRYPELPRRAPAPTEEQRETL